MNSATICEEWDPMTDFAKGGIADGDCSLVAAFGMDHGCLRSLSASTGRCSAPGIKSDIYDGFCSRHPRTARVLGWRIEPVFKVRKLIFIHVPRAAGASVAEALGARPQSHYSMRYYRAVAPRFAAEADSFAVLRDPFEHFASGYAIVLQPAARSECALAGTSFCARTAHVRHSGG